MTKRILAWLLTAVMLFSMLPTALAEDPCTHPEPVEYDGWQDPASCTYTSVNDQYHEITGAYGHGTYCDTCGMGLTYAVTDEVHTERQQHNYDENGVCADCGHVNGCAHASTYSIWLFTSEPSVAQADGKYHTRSGEAELYTFCNICNMMLTKGEPEQHTESVEHEYDDGGVCGECGYVNTCTHPEPLVNSATYFNLIFIDTGDNQVHHVTADSMETFSRCPVCNARLYVISSGAVDEYWDHTYDQNGVCINCGHANTCEHTNTEYAEWWDGEITIENTGDAHNHKVTGTKVHETRCKDCGMSLSRSEQTEEDVWGHSFENGVCTECGYVNTCVHESTYVYTGAAKGLNITYTEIEGNNRYHMETAERAAEYTYCSDCGEELAYTELEQAYSKQGEHWYGENGTDACWDCHHVNTCAHANTTESWWWRDVDQLTFTAVDNETHTVSGAYNTEIQCLDCGTWLGVTLQPEPRTETREHNFVDGVCTECGHKNTCTHENVYYYFEPSGDVRFVPDDNGLTHSKVTDGWIVTCCEKCYAEVARTSVSNAIVNNEHYYAEGKCIECGYQNTCKHEHTSEYEQLWDEDEVLSFDEKYHTVRGSGRIVTICTDCDEELAHQDAESITTTYIHYFENGVCTTCGYKNVCTHPNKQSSDYAVAAFSYDPNAEGGHLVTGHKISREYCPDCHENWPETLTLNTTFVERHTMYNGACIYCGHTHTEETIPATATCTEDGLGEGTKCSVCGDILVAQEELQAYGHNYVDGVCTICGEAEPSAATPEPEAPAAQPEAPAAQPEAPAAEPTAEEAKAAEVTEALAENEDLKDAAVSVKTDEAGNTTVAVAVEAKPQENSTAAAVEIKTESVAQLKELEVDEIKVENADGNVSVTIDVETLNEIVEDKSGAKLIIEVDEEIELNETIAKKVAETYTFVGEPVAVKVLLVEEDGTTTEIGEAKKLLISLEIERGDEKTVILYIDKDGNTTVTEAVWVEATDDAPAHWEVPYLGEGNYVPVVVK